MSTRARLGFFLGLFIAAGCNGNGGGGNVSDGGGGGNNGDDGGGGNNSAPDLAMPKGGLCDTAPADAATARQQSQYCPVGSGARFFLRPAPYTKVLVEIDATASTMPRQAAIDHLKAVIGDV